MMPQPSRSTVIDFAPAPDPLDGLDAAVAVPPAQARLAGWIRVVCGVVGLLVVLLALGVAGVFLYATASSTGVVAGRVVSVSTLIAGTVHGAQLEVGDRVEQGQLVVAVHNDLVDRGRLSSLRTGRAAVAARLDAVRAGVASKSVERSRLRSEFEQERVYVGRDLEGGLLEAQAKLAGLVAARDRLESESRSATALFERQLIPRLTYERAHAELVGGARAVDAQAAQVARLEDGMRALLDGVFQAPGMRAQKSRIDDLGDRLVELQVSEHELEANLADLDRALTEEEQQVARQSAAAMSSPVTGYVWKRGTNAGQHVMAGSQIMELVDEGSIRVEAYFHQKYLRNVAIGDDAMVSPAGSGLRIHATVRWMGAIDTANDATVAPQQWERKQSMPMRVVLSIGQPDQSRVWIGQYAKVIILPRSANSVATRVTALLTTFLPGW